MLGSETTDAAEHKQQLDPELFLSRIQRSEVSSFNSILRVRGSRHVRRETVWTVSERDELRRNLSALNCVASPEDLRDRAYGLRTVDDTDAVTDKP